MGDYGTLPGGTTQGDLDAALEDPNALPAPIAEVPCNYGLCEREAEERGYCMWHARLTRDVHS